MAEIVLVGSAQEDHRNAFEAFDSLVTGEPVQAQRSFALYAAREQQPDAPVPRLRADAKAALATMATYFASGTDLYTVFPEEIEASSYAAKQVWQTLNLSSRSAPEAEAAAKTAWRHERVALYIAQVVADAQPMTQTITRARAA